VYGERARDGTTRSTTSANSAAAVPRGQGLRRTDRPRPVVGDGARAAGREARVVLVDDRVRVVGHQRSDRPRLLADAAHHARQCEDQRQFTQEFRLASAAGAPVRLADTNAFRWQAGVSLFTQDYAQDAVNSFSPYVLSTVLPFTVNQHSPLATLDDTGLGAYGQGTLSLYDAWDISVGARVDSERKAARLETFYEPALAPPSVVDEQRTFTDVSPQASLAFRAAPGRTLYVSAARGFKAGGFNPASPPGSEAYSEEHAWNLEGGLKSTWANGRLSANATAFHIVWDDMQLPCRTAGARPVLHRQCRRRDLERARGGGERAAGRRCGSVRVGGTHPGPLLRRERVERCGRRGERPAERAALHGIARRAFFRGRSAEARSASDGRTWCFRAPIIMTRRTWKDRPPTRW